METLWQDLRFGTRMLWKNRAFTAIAVFALALGIGANSAIFTVVNAVLLRPLPYEESERLMLLSERAPQLEGMSISYPNFIDWRAQNRVFEQLGVFRRQSFNLTGERLEPERLQGGEVSHEIFAALRAKAALGRVFSSEDDKPGATPVTVLSHGLWERRFGRDPNILGKTLTLSSVAYTVIGVMPPDYSFPSRTDLWTPVGLNASNPNWNRGNHPGLYGIARLKPGVTLEQARADMDTIAIQLEKQYPDSNTGGRVTVNNLYEQIVGPFRPMLLVLLAAVGAVLLIACANVANLLLARAAKRQKEIALRTALGAGRIRLIRQLLTESLLLSLIGGVLGMLLAVWGTKLILAISDPNTIPRFREISVDATVLGFTLLISVLTGIVFGLAPALQATRVSLLNETLKEGTRSATGGVRSQRLRGLLVVSEVAIALVLLIGAGLLIKSFYRLQQVSLGFDPASVLTVGVSLPQVKYKEEEKRVAFFEQLMAKARALPGVVSASAISQLPLESGNQTSIVIEGTNPEPGKFPLTEIQSVKTDYFRTMGVQLMKGRDFTTQDSKDAPQVAIIDDNFAKKFWPNQDPLGKRYRHTGPPGKTPWITVIGVTRNVKFQGITVEDQRVMVYRPHSQNPHSGMTIVLRTAVEPTSLASALRREVASIDPDQPVHSVRAMTEIVNNSIASQRMSMTLLGLFAAVALLLAVVGIYGVVSYSVTQRTQEIGIRMALGARTRDVLAMVLKQGMVMVLVGVLLGLGGAFALTRAMASLLFGVSATDPLIFTALSVVLVIVSLFACFVPARRATKVDPMVALRYE